MKENVAKFRLIRFFIRNFVERTQGVIILIVEFIYKKIIFKRKYFYFKNDILRNLSTNFDNVIIFEKNLRTFFVKYF